MSALILIYGKKLKIIKDNNVNYFQSCPNCHPSELYVVLAKESPHLYFIPLPFLSYPVGVLYCRRCKNYFEFQKSTSENLTIKYYAGKISKEELIRGLKNEISYYVCTKCGSLVGIDDIKCKKCKSLLALDGATKKVNHNN